MFDRRDAVIEAMRDSAQRSLGFALFVEEVGIGEYESLKAQLAVPPKLFCSITVSRGHQMQTRILGLSAHSLLEMDADTQQVIVKRPVQEIFAIVRSETADQQFHIELIQGGTISFACAQRDILLSNILDIAGCEIPICSESFASWKIGPRFTPHDTANEELYIKRMNNSRDAASLLTAVLQFNANLPTTGIQTKDKKLLPRLFELFRVSNSSSRVSVLQCIQRLLSSRTIFDELARTSESVSQLVEVVRTGSEMYALLSHSSFIYLYEQ